MKKVFLTGAYGVLGSELVKLISKRKTLQAFYKQSSYLNICLIDQIYDFFKEIEPDICIHCAALKKATKRELMDVNIGGTINIVRVCLDYKVRLVYISTDYVYPGVHGLYSEDDDVNPIDYYSWTKLGGEAAVKAIDNHLIIRTSFYPKKFPYKIAYKNKYTSKDYVDIIAKIILKISLSKETGVINIGTGRKSEYDLAKRRTPSIDFDFLPDGFMPEDSSFSK